MKIKLLLGFVLVGIFGLAVSAQTNSVVSNFEKNKTKYKLEKFAEGEDASSGFDYLYYKSRNQIVKVRVIWSSSANPNYTIDDFYYKNGKLIAKFKYDLAKKNYKNAKLGKMIPLKESESFLITDNKMTVWIENKKNVSKTDARWSKKEKEILESGNSHLEYYQELKAG